MGDGNNKKTIVSYKSLGLTLAPGNADWSVPATFNFSVPKNAKVQKIEFNHGTAQTGGRHMLGAIPGRKLELTSPNGKVRSVDWNRRPFEDIKGFFQNDVYGQWSVRMYGQNIATPSSDYMTNLRFWGSVIYKRPELTITYTLE